MVDKSDKHRKIFNLGARALQKRGFLGEEYICPICCRIFDERAIRKDASDDYCLTLEHSPPEKIGGTVLTLTCKRCNNMLGSKLDSQVAARERLFSFFTLREIFPDLFRQ